MNEVPTVPGMSQPDYHQRPQPKPSKVFVKGSDGNFYESNRPSIAVGPIPPRDPKTGKYLLKPRKDRLPRVNKATGLPVEDPANPGELLYEERDTRHPSEYRAYESGMHRHLIDGATKGLKLFKIEHIGGAKHKEITTFVYGRDVKHAFEVWKKELGVVSFIGQDHEIRICEADDFDLADIEEAGNSPIILNPRPANSKPQRWTEINLDAVLIDEPVQRRVAS